MTHTERTYYLVYALYCASWAFLTPAYPLFLLSRGLDLFEINVVFAVYLIGAFLFEVPTGAVADVVGRKVSFLLSCGIRSVAFIMYWYADGFVDCVVAEFVDALGTTLATGALDAWAVDGMRDEGSQRPADRVFARAFMYASPLMIVTGVIGGYLFDINPGLPWPCGAACFVTAGVTGLLLMREQRRPARPAHGVLRSWVATTRNGFATVRQAPVLLVLCLLTAAVAFAVMPAWHYWPARLQALSGTGTWLLGWVWALIALSGMAGNALMPRLVPRFRREPVLAIANMWRGSMLVLGALSSDFLFAALAVLCLQLVFGLSEPALQGWMNEHVGSEVRATVLSVRSMAFTLGGGAGLVCLGLLARSNGIPTAWLTAGVLVILAAPGFFLLALAAPARAAPPDRPLASPTP